jgi:ribosomal protein S27E
MLWRFDRTLTIHVSTGIRRSVVWMAESFINLNCPNCGAKLDVYDDMDRFTCSHCGTEMVAQRRGGTVALKAVTEAIRRVQVGTDKTAAELAIVRYEKDIAILMSQRAKVALKRFKGQGCVVLGCLFALCSIASLLDRSFGFVVVFTGMGIGLVLKGGALWTANTVEQIDNDIKSLTDRITEKMLVANASI